jgi:hypothetical protein
MKVRLVDSGEQVSSRDWEEASIQSHLQATVISADWVVDGDQMSSCLKSAFDLHLLERTHDRWMNMSSSQDPFAEFHEISDRVIFVMDDLVELARTTAGILGMSIPLAEPWQ